MKMPEPILVLGADGGARQVATVVDAINGHEPVWDLIGFLADEPAASRTQGCRVLGTLDAVQAFPAATLVCGMRGRPYQESRLALVTRLGVEPERFATLIDPRAVVAEPEMIAEGSVIEAGAVLGQRVTIGMHARIEPNAVLTSDVMIDAGASIGPTAALGEGVVVSHGATIGAGAIVREYVHIGANATVGMGAVVTHDVPSGATWFGVPARSRRSVVTEAGS